MAYFLGYGVKLFIENSKYVSTTKHYSHWNWWEKVPKVKIIMFKQCEIKWIDSTQEQVFSKDQLLGWTSFIFNELFYDDPWTLKLESTPKKKSYVKKSPTSVIIKIIFPSLKPKEKYWTKIAITSIISSTIFLSQ